MSKDLVNLTLTEVAERIDRHLRRIEAKQRAAAVKDGTAGDAVPGRFFMANSGVHGNRVGVLYVSYQGKTNITREEALHYLRGLDSGFEGSHFVYFQKNPVPKEDEPEIRVLALVRTQWGTSLFGVTRRTDKFIFGTVVKGDSQASRVARRDVLKMQATEEDYDRLIALKEERDEKVGAIQDEYRRKVRELLGKDDEG